jgi:hypothetical protein
VLRAAISGAGPAASTATSRRPDLASPDVPAEVARHARTSDMILTLHPSGSRPAGHSPSAQVISHLGPMPWMHRVDQVI